MDHSKNRPATTPPTDDGVGPRVYSYSDYLNKEQRAEHERRRAMRPGSAPLQLESHGGVRFKVSTWRVRLSLWRVRMGVRFRTFITNIGLQ